MKFSMIAVMAVFFAFTSSGVIAQENTNNATGQMKETGKETKKAGKSMAKNVKKGRVATGGKHFGKHMGKAGNTLAAAPRRPSRK